MASYVFMGASPNRVDRKLSSCIIWDGDRRSIFFKICKRVVLTFHFSIYVFVVDESIAIYGFMAS